jgi:hypothetical protein
LDLSEAAGALINGAGTLADAVRYPNSIANANDFQLRRTIK